MSLEVRLYRDDDSARWDELLSHSFTDNFLLSRKFLSYHKERFCDLSLIIEDKNGKVEALFPAAKSLIDHDEVVSHPGLTYGGLIFSGRKNPNQIQEIMVAVCRFYASQGFRRLLYKSVPTHLRKGLDAIDLYVLWRLGAKVCRRDIWNVISLTMPRKLSKGRKWGVNKAKRNDVLTVRNGTTREDYINFHRVLTESLLERYGVKPVHTVEEMWELKELFRMNIHLWIVESAAGECLAGSWVFHFHSARVWHTQYLFSSKTGRELLSLDLLIETLCRQAEEEKLCYMSFGASTEENGLRLNEGLFDFKGGFGFGSNVQDFFEIQLKDI